MKKEIGIVTMNYNHDGRVEYSHFKPTMLLQADGALLSQLKTVRGKDENEVKSNAELVFASSFNKMIQTLDDIEVADRTKFKLVSDVLQCDKYPDTGRIRGCKIKFSLVEIESVVTE